MSATATVSPSASQSPQLCAPGAQASGVAFSAGSIIALRVGSGVTPLSTSTTALREAFLDEIALSSGARLQSIALSDSGACAVSSGSSTEGYISLSADRSYLLVPCWAVPANGTLASATQRKTIAVVRADASVDFSTSFVDSSSIYRSVASFDGQYAYAGTSLGVRGVPIGVASAASVALTTTSAASIRGIAAFGGRIWASTTNGVISPVNGSSVALNQALTHLNGAPLITGVSSLVWQDASTLWVGAFSGAPVTKLVLDPVSGNWTAAPVVSSANFTLGGVPFSLTGARGMTGTVINGAYTLVWATAGSPNWIVAYNTVTGVVTPLRQACGSTEFKGVGECLSSYQTRSPSRAS